MKSSRQHGNRLPQDAFIKYWRRELEKLDTEQILRWALETFGARITLATTFDLAGRVLFSMLTEIRPDVAVVNIDPAGRHCLASLGRNFEAVILGHRRDQSTYHADMPILSWDEQYGLFRIAPLARWSEQGLTQWARRKSLPSDERFCADIRQTESSHHRDDFAEERARDTSGEITGSHNSEGGQIGSEVFAKKTIRTGPIPRFGRPTPSIVIQRAVDSRSVDQASDSPEVRENDKAFDPGGLGDEHAFSSYGRPGPLQSLAVLEAILDDCPKAVFAFSLADGPIYANACFLDLWSLDAGSVEAMTYVDVGEAVAVQLLQREHFRYVVRKLQPWTEALQCHPVTTLEGRRMLWVRRFLQVRDFPSNTIRIWIFEDEFNEGFSDFGKIGYDLASGKNGRSGGYRKNVQHGSGGDAGKNDAMALVAYEY